MAFPVCWVKDGCKWRKSIEEWRVDFEEYYEEEDIEESAPISTTEQAVPPVQKSEKEPSSAPSSAEKETAPKEKPVEAKKPAGKKQASISSFFKKRSG